MTPREPQESKKISRRSFLHKGSTAVAAAAAAAAALSPLRHIKPGDLPSREEFFQKHYKEMTDADKKDALDRIAAKVAERHNIEPTIHDYPPLDGVEYVYGLNVSRCIECRRCVYACAKENNTSQSPEIQYIRVLQMEKGGIDLETSNHHYDPPTVPDRDKFYMPVQCHQCANPPCVKVCPTEATWQEADGIVVVDYDWCIGCRYCEAACPYWARRFNFDDPGIPSNEINTDMAYLSNRPREKGVVEKCTFCLQRTRQGKFPACLEVCPTGSRKFGNVLDPESEVAYILAKKRIFVLKQDVGTLPRFFYYFDERGSRYHEEISAESPGGEA